MHNTMKKYILIAILGLVALFAQAQVPGTNIAFVNDTTTNSETEYLVLASPSPIFVAWPMAIYVKPVNASGTATVTATPQGSMDNTNWYDLESAATVNNAGTVALKSFVYPNSYFKYYRIKLVSSGTGVTNFTGGMLLKRQGLLK